MNFNGSFYHYLQESIRNRETCLELYLIEILLTQISGIISVPFSKTHFLIKCFKYSTGNIHHIACTHLNLNADSLSNLIYFFAYLILLFK